MPVYKSQAKINVDKNNNAMGIHLVATVEASPLLSLICVWCLPDWCPPRFSEPLETYGCGPLAAKKPVGQTHNTTHFSVISSTPLGSPQISTYFDWTRKQNPVFATKMVILMFNQTLPLITFDHVITFRNKILGSWGLLFQYQSSKYFWRCIIVRTNSTNFNLHKPIVAKGTQWPTCFAHFYPRNILCNRKKKEKKKKKKSFSQRRNFTQTVASKLPISISHTSTNYFYL